MTIVVDTNKIETSVNGNETTLEIRTDYGFHKLDLWDFTIDELMSFCNIPDEDLAEFISESSEIDLKKLVIKSIKELDSDELSEILLDSKVKDALEEIDCFVSYKTECTDTLPETDELVLLFFDDMSGERDPVVGKFVKVNLTSLENKDKIIINKGFGEFEEYMSEYYRDHVKYDYLFKVSETEYYETDYIEHWQNIK